MIEFVLVTEEHDRQTPHINEAMSEYRIPDDLLICDEDDAENDRDEAGAPYATLPLI